MLYESDRFLGYDNRFSASAGYGYGLIREPMMTLDVTIGPAYRFTDYVAAMDENDDELRKAIATKTCSDGGYPLDVI